MPRRLDRYVFREILAPFVLGVAAFTFILLIARILKLVELVINRGVPVVDTIKLFSYLLPFFLEVTVPTAMLLAVLMALGRLSADSEIIALRASGISLPQIARPVAAFVILAWGLTTVLSLYVRPWGQAAMRRTMYEVAKNRATAGLTSDVFNDDFEKLVIYVDDIDPATNLMRRVVIADGRSPEARSTLFAREGRLVPNEGEQKLVLRLYKGSMHTFGRTDTSYHKTDFAEYDVRLDLSALQDGGQRETDASELTFTDLRAAVAAKRAAGENAGAELLELHRKFSIPFACVVFGFLGTALGIQPVRAVRSRGFALSLATTFCYYLFLTGGETLAKNGTVHAATALWLPNVVFGAAGVYLFLANAREWTAREWVVRWWHRTKAHGKARPVLSPR